MKFVFSVLSIVPSLSVSLNRHEALNLEVEKHMEMSDMGEPFKRDAIKSLLKGAGLGSIRNEVEHATRNFKDFGSLNLPKSVQSLVSTHHNIELDEDSITKARQILNGMVETAQNELDAKLIECKEFLWKNRKTWWQVITDLNFMTSSIADLESKKSDSNTKINETSDQINALELEMTQERNVMDEDRRVDEEDMKVRKNDLKVATFLLRLTKCKDGEGVAAGFLQSEKSPHKIQHCVEHPKHGKKVHTFSVINNSHMNMAMLSLSSHGKKIVNTALMSVTGDDPVAEDQAQEEDQGAAEGTSQPASERKQSKKCTLGKPNCGLLHDNMSLMWGKMKDSVDELTEDMEKKASDRKKQEDNWNEQLQILGEQKSTASKVLSESTSQQTADKIEKDALVVQEHHLSHEFHKKLMECMAEIHEILFTKICGVLSARGVLHKKSNEVKPNDIVDCEVSDWTVHECSVPCDDALEGGEQDLTRDVVQKPNEFGVKCPKLNWVSKCNQIPCPIKCEMEDWEGWSACTAECGGGVQSRARAIDIRPKNGGQACDVASESRACNTGSCDRDCQLTNWKKRPCTVACGGGFKVKKKHVKPGKEARGNGKCAKAGSWQRYRKNKCNMHDCYGDEECVAKQDTVVALDGSGSVKEVGFQVLRDFAADLVRHMRPETEEWVTDFNNVTSKQNVTASQVGVIQFGQGVLEEDGTVGPAEIVFDMSNDTAAAADAIDGLEWRRGFTNMAQGFTMAKTLFLNGGRSHAQSVVIMISDGNPSFHYQTQAAVKELRRGGVKIVMVVVKEFPDQDKMNELRQWASDPSDTNFIHIPGLKRLSTERKHWVNKVLIHSCPKTVSVIREEKYAEMLKQKQAVEELATGGTLSAGTMGQPTMFLG